MLLSYGRREPSQANLKVRQVSLVPPCRFNFSVGTGVATPWDLVFARKLPFFLLSVSDLKSGVIMVIVRE